MSIEEIKILNEKLSEYLPKNEEKEQLTLELAKQIIDDLDVTEEEVKEKSLKTSYSEYKGFGTYDYMIIDPEDFQQYCFDIARQFAMTMPDGLEDFVNYEEMGKYMIKDLFILQQVQDYLDDKGEDVDKIEKLEWTPYHEFYLLTL